MSDHSPSHTAAVLEAASVTFLWSTSWVLIKIGLGSIPALPFAGLRYVLAFIVLIPFALRPARLSALRSLTPRAWLRLALLGVLFYAATQGTQYLALGLLPAITTNLLISFSTVAVTLLGMAFLGEQPHSLQWAGMLMYLAGVVVYFWPLALPAGQIAGILWALACVLANALSSVLGRGVNRAGDLDPLTVTVASMGIGSLALLGSGVAVQGLPPLSGRDWLTVAWLAVVNTSFAFTLWNRTLRTLSAMESSIINSLMLVLIPLLAWGFLGEGFTTRDGIGMLIAGLGILTVQLRRRTPAVEPAAIQAVPEKTDTRSG